MKKFLCIVLTISMLCVCSIPINASNNTVNSTTDQSLDIVSKNMSTGEITYSTFSYNAKQQTYSTNNAYSHSLYTETTESWFPTIGQTTYDYNNSNIAPCTIGDEDNRVKVTDTTENPYRTICYIESTFRDGTTSATAFIIYKNIAITAAHAVYDSNLGGLANSIKLWPGKDGYSILGNPFGTTTVTASATTIHMPDNWSTEYRPMDDWALIVLDEDIGYETGWFGIGWSTKDFTGTQVTITGYPQHKLLHNYHQYTMTDYITECTAELLYYSNLDVSSGQSGSPVYTNDYIACGIHCYGGTYENYGPRITEAMFNYFKTFME